MKFKTNVPNTAPLSPRAELERKYNNCRVNLLLVVLFTVVNLFTVTFGNTYFLFSATIPMLLPLGFSGVAADPEFLAELGIAAEAITPILIAGLVCGLILTVPYLLCWIFSKKRVGWMVAALVLFSLDCLFLLITFDLSMIADILIHAWVMFYLITGVIHGFKLKNMPEDEPLPEFGTVTPEGETPAAENAFHTFDPADFSDGTAVPAETAEDRGDAFVAKEDQE